VLIQLIPWSRVFEKLPVAQLVKNYLPLWNWTANHSVHKTMDSILRQMTPVYNIISPASKIHLYIILSSPNWIPPPFRPQVSSTEIFATSLSIPLYKFGGQRPVTEEHISSVFKTTCEAIK
jgi:hypothetical protein